MSLIPSATEIVTFLGAHHTLVGRSHGCDLPRSGPDVPILTHPRAGSVQDQPADSLDIHTKVTEHAANNDPLYVLDDKHLADLRPDLVITQDICGVCAVDLTHVQSVIKDHNLDTRVLALNPQGIEDILDDITRVAHALGLESKGRQEVVSLRQRMDAAQINVNAYDDGPNVLLLEWTDPPFVGGHWSVQLIERAGAQHPLNPTHITHGSGAAAGPQMAERIAGKSIAVDPLRIAESAPDRIIVAPCGYTLDQARDACNELWTQPWFRSLPASQSGHIAIVDGHHMFHRPGPRIVDAFEFLVGWINAREHLIPSAFPWERFEPAQ